MTALIVGVWVLFAAVMGVLTIAFWLSRPRDADRDGSGRIIERPGHRCRPPSSHEWAGGELKVTNTARYPDGTKWRCSCGRAWWSTYGYRGLWLRWERDSEQDEIPEEAER